MSKIEHQLVGDPNFTSTVAASSASCTADGPYLDGQRYTCSVHSGNEQQTNDWLLTSTGIGEISGGGSGGSAPQTAADAAQRIARVPGETRSVSCLPNANSGADAYTCLIGNAIFDMQWAADGTITRFVLQSP